MQYSGTDALSASAIDARRWVQILARYREPNHVRSATELGISLGAFVAIWALAWWALSVSYLLAMALAVLNGFFIVRIFAIQHDCGHSAFFRNGTVSDWIGRALGILTLTPYDVWRRTHAMHHASSGNLDRRGMGDVYTLTVAEYRAKSWLGRLGYRVYRNPLVLFGLGPAYLFILQNRLPLGLMRSGWRYWTSAMGTNAGIIVILALLYFFGGWQTLALIFLPTVLIGATIGVWLFYVQHQFEDTNWQTNADWQIHDAALHGSSHYVMPAILQWLTANIGVHHVHHLYARIPFYRLPEVLRDHAELAQAQRMTIGQSLKSARLHLWDEAGQRLLSFRQERRVAVSTI